MYRRIMNNLPGDRHRENGSYHIDIPLTVVVQRALLLQAGFDQVEVFYERIESAGSSAGLVAWKKEGM